MDYRIYREADFVVSKWTGGTTTQTAIFPEDAVYLKRNFLWRLSTATCEQEESDFSRLPDYDRVLMVLEGQVILTHQDQRVAKLSALEQDSFDGAWRTKSFGKITDYNLMVAKGNAGQLQVVLPDETSRPLALEQHPEYHRWTCALYCRDGYSAVTIAGDTLMLNQGQQLVVNGEAGEEPQISIMGEGCLIQAQIFYQYHEDEMGPETIPREKATFDDFKTCVYLANSQFRGARFIFRNLKNQWKDEELSKAMAKVERVYLPCIVAILGLCIVAGIGEGQAWNGFQWVIAIILWILVDMLMISPLMYFAVVPKPVRKHIKDIHHLTPYEEQVREKELATNQRTERILKKYKHTGMARYDEEGNRLDRTF